jgi:hypothetical protein
LAVYVDQPLFRLGRMRTCHLWADDLPELHAFARALDARLPAHFQCPPAASWDHYDIGKGLRTRAIALGAIETDRYGCVEHVARLAGDERKLALVAKLRARRDGPRPAPDLFGR